MDQQSASIDDLNDWAAHVMVSREPDYIIGGAHNPYIKRWWIIPRNPFSNLYLHETVRSDDDRAMHDHPFDNTSVVLLGGYREHTPEGVYERKPGDVIFRPANSLHRLEIEEGGRSVSLFFTGPKIREWGFQCPQGWRHWRDFTGGAFGETVGRGCGES